MFKDNNIIPNAILDNDNLENKVYSPIVITRQQMNDELQEQRKLSSALRDKRKDLEHYYDEVCQVEAEDRYQRVKRQYEAKIMNQNNDINKTK